MRTLLTLIAILISFQVFAESRSGTICYFSLNNPKEQKYMSNLATTLNKKTGSNIKVIEKMPAGQNPEVAFEQMVQEMTHKNEKCDALVISGHHYGEWDGLRADGALRIGTLEKLACDPRYENWFRQINALYLQGCRTVGAEDIKSNNPNSHSVRVHGAAGEDSITEDQRVDLMTGLNYGFSNLLSTSNVLSSRYLKAFPRATTFGWKDSAPGFMARSEMSFLYHVAHMAHANKPYQVANENKVEVTNENAAKLATAILDLIQKPKDDGGLDPCEDRAITSWNAHIPGAKAIHSHTHDAFTNPSLEKARKLGCKLKNAKTTAERKSALDEILANDTYIGQNLNFMMELMQGPHSNEVGSTLKQSGNLDKFLEKAVKAKNVGLLVKIDYYTFYKSVFGKTNDSMESILDLETKEYLLKPLPSPGSLDRDDAIAFRRAVFQSMGVNGYPNEEYMKSLYNSGETGKKLFKILWNIMTAESVLQGESTRPRTMQVRAQQMKQLTDKLQSLASTVTSTDL